MRCASCFSVSQPGCRDTESINASECFTARFICYSSARRYRDDSAAALRSFLSFLWGFPKSPFQFAVLISLWFELLAYPPRRPSGDVSIGIVCVVRQSNAPHRHLARITRGAIAILTAVFGLPEEFTGKLPELDRILRYAQAKVEEGKVFVVRLLASHVKSADLVIMSGMDEAALATVRSAFGTRIGGGAVPSQGLALHAADIKAMPLHPFSLLIFSAVLRECSPVCCVQVPASQLIYTDQSFSMLPQCKFVQLPRLRSNIGPPWESCSKFICGLEKLAIILSQLILLSRSHPSIRLASTRRPGDRSASTNLGTSWHIGRHTTCGLC